jgi:hypothetical protein
MLFLKLIPIFLLIGLSSSQTLDCKIVDFAPAIENVTVDYNEIRVDWMKPAKSLGYSVQTVGILDEISMIENRQNKIIYKDNPVEFWGLKNGLNYSLVLITRDDEGFEFYSAVEEVTLEYAVRLPGVEGVTFQEVNLPPLNGSYSVNVLLSFAIPPGFVEFVTGVEVSGGKNDAYLPSADIGMVNEVNVELTRPNNDYEFDIKLISNNVQKFLDNTTTHRYTSPPKSEYFDQRKTAFFGQNKGKLNHFIPI